MTALTHSILVPVLRYFPLALALILVVYCVRAKRSGRAPRRQPLPKVYSVLVGFALIVGVGLLVFRTIAGR